jgi:DNA-binding transcriptional ArsR family regulator
MLVWIQPTKLKVYMENLRTDEFREIAERLKTIAHPARIGILQLLDEGDKNLHELYEQLGCSQSAMSQHIRILRDRRRIECRKGRHLQILRGSHRFASASD